MSKFHIEMDYEIEEDEEAEEITEEELGTNLTEYLEDGGPVVTNLKITKL